MKTAAPAKLPIVPREEVERRIAEYRRLGFQRRSAAVIVYPPPQQLCPWPGCGTTIAGIDFQLDQMGNAAQREMWMTAWWQGSGLVGRCPGCRRYVLFGYEEKRTVDNPAAFADTLLLDDWVDTAHIAPRPQG